MMPGSSYFGGLNSHLAKPALTFMGCSNKETIGVVEPDEASAGASSSGNGQAEVTTPAFGVNSTLAMTP